MRFAGHLMPHIRIKTSANDGANLGSVLSVKFDHDKDIAIYYQVF